MSQRLAEVAQVSTGPFGSLLHKSDYVDDGVPLVNPVNIVDQLVIPNHRKLIDQATARRLASYALKEGDIVVGRRGDIGRCAVIGPREDGWLCGTGCFFLRPSRNINARFLAHLIRSEDYRERLRQASTGTTMQNLSNAALGDLVVVVPPLSEQQWIVGILDEAFEDIATAKVNAEKNLRNALAAFESHLESIFTQRGAGWMDKRLEEVGATQTGSTPKTADRDNYGDFIPFVKPADFNRDGSLDYENRGLTELGLSQARRVVAESVLMVCIGATIGKCGYCDRDIATNQQINALTPHNGVCHKFVYFQMLTEDFQRRVVLSSGQSTLPIISKSKWGGLSLAIPPTVREQQLITAELGALRAETQDLESIYQRKLAALDELKTSLLHQAFSGNL